ncbi:MAG: hypothetical protein LJE84_11585 [Gammaproteobacteria bacterium]|nr:hypothetical protein [Gammaproteobacteria bacterium]
MADPTKPRELFNDLVASGLTAVEASLKVARLPVVPGPGKPMHWLLLGILASVLASGYVSLFTAFFSSGIPLGLATISFLVWTGFASVLYPVYRKKWWSYLLAAGFFLVGNVLILFKDGLYEEKAFGAFAFVLALATKYLLFPHQRFFTGPQREADGLFAFDKPEWFYQNQDT